MVEVRRARTAPGPREESSACLIPSSFRLGPPPSDRTLMSTRYKPLQGSTTVVGGGPASALLETALPVRYFPSTIRSQKSEHVTRRGMSRATTPLLGPGVCDATCGRQVVLRLPPRSSASTPYSDMVTWTTSAHSFRRALRRLGSVADFWGGGPPPLSWYHRSGPK